MEIDNYVFTVVLLFALFFFASNIRKLTKKIALGKKNISSISNKRSRVKNVILIALGQSKMAKKPISGILHTIVYISFILMNIELLEICIDGIFGTHRFFAFMGSFYNFVIAFFEYLALSVIVSVIIFWTRRNIHKISRFLKKELQGWPKNDANIILYAEFFIMLFFLLMNTFDYILQSKEVYIQAGYYPISSLIAPLFENLNVEILNLWATTFWWLHIIGILLFLNYLYYSKHLHIILAFPTVFYAKLSSLGQLDTIKSITTEIRSMLNLPSEKIADDYEKDATFGVQDITDLKRTDIISAYACTECGRCTDQCPANQTGKLLSPRKIMMDIRDRTTNFDKEPDKKLLHDYISEEELWACTSCMACADACPININPMQIIMQMRQYIVMENAQAPSTLNHMMTTLENNGVPWAYNNKDRINWITE